VLLAEIKRTLQHIALNVFQKLRYMIDDAVEWLACLFFRLTTGYFHSKHLRCSSTLPKTIRLKSLACTYFWVIQL